MHPSNSDAATLGRDLTALTIGIDRFQRQAGEDTLLGGEGLVPIFIGQDLVDAERVESWEQARAGLTSLIARADALPDAPRARFLRAMARSVRAAVRLFSGEPITYREKLTDLVSVDDQPVASDVIDELRDSVLSTIAYYGYRSGSPVERVAKWESDRAVPAEKIPVVFDELMTEAKRRTDATIFDTGDYTMRLRPLRNAHYTARCAFDDGCMDINLDVSFTRSALKHLVCHEVFPGHSTQLLSTRAGVIAGTSPSDALLCTTNGATGSVQEGIGDQGIELLDWVEDDHDHAHIELRRLQTAAGTNAAYHLAESGWTTEQSEAYLRDVAFGHPEWARGRTVQAKHPFRGPFLASYWFGNEAVRTARLRTPPESRKRFIEYLYGQVNTPESLTMFATTTA